MPRRKAGTSLPVARRATTMIPWRRSFSACGGAEGSSRCAGMSLPYGSAELLHLNCSPRGFAVCDCFK
ncbi:MAG: hypothetical protein IKS21_06435 [Oscillospiraceae bacterium]|nr:hypothetical protein [Oscillospiraceae bacterium]